MLKAMANIVAALIVLPAVGWHWAESWMIGRERSFSGWSQSFALVPGLLGQYLRRAFYRWVLDRCGRDVVIGFGTVISHPTARLGDRVYVGAYCVLGDVTLEDNVLLASGVSVANGTAQHGIQRLDIPIRDQPGSLPRVTIGEDTWVGERATVLADVGRHCVVGAGSVVTEPIPDYTIAVGVPARVIRDRRADTTQQNAPHDRTP